PQRFNIGHQVLGGIGLRCTERRAASASALLVEDDAVGLRIEKAPLTRIAAAARTAVEEQYRRGARIAAFLVIQRVPFADREQRVVIWFNGGEQEVFHR